MPDDAGSTPGERSRPRAVDMCAWLLEHAQDLVSVIVGAVLIVLAATVLISGIVDFFTDLGKMSLEASGVNLLGRVLLVLILIEIVLAFVHH